MRRSVSLWDPLTETENVLWASRLFLHNFSLTQPKIKILEKETNQGQFYEMLGDSICSPLL